MTSESESVNESLQLQYFFMIVKKC